MIENFPRGRSTGDLLRMRNIDFSPRARRGFVLELESLSREGLVELGTDGKWRAKTRRHTVEPTSVHYPRMVDSQEVDQLLMATPAHFSQIPAPAREAESDEMYSESPDPQALLRYYRSALRSDPRGALSQTPDRHGTVFQLVVGTGRWWGGNEQLGEIRLTQPPPPEFREALSKRKANENSLAVGWPIAVGRNLGAWTVWPVGLFAAEWRREDSELIVTVGTDGVLVNPDWIKAASRSTTWSESELTEIFWTSGNDGMSQDEFQERLNEAMAKSILGTMQGLNPVGMLDSTVSGIHDAVALFLPTESSFTIGAVRDLDKIATWSPDRLSKTALAPILGLGAPSTEIAAPVINDGPLNAEQIKAVSSALQNPLTVVTGPPGTGKSQAIVATVVSALAANQRVLVASKNHQALDAVEDRLMAIASGVSFMVRTLDRTGEINVNLRTVLNDLVNDSPAAPLRPDPNVSETLVAISEERKQAMETIEECQRLNVLLAGHIERKDAIAISRDYSTKETITPQSKPFWLFRWFLKFRKDRLTPSDNEQEDEVPVGSDLRSLEDAITRDRKRLQDLSLDSNPVEITNRIAELARKHLPRVLSSMATVSEEERLQLTNQLRDLELTGEPNLNRDLVTRVLDHRPLWLASILGAPKRIDLHDNLFDLVIFDEASQCDIASAFPLLARSRRAAVVGDDRQLAFISKISAAQDRNLMKAQGLPVEGMGRFAQGRVSLFDLARATPNTPAILLRNQYRSASEIVGYLNDQFYGGQLRTCANLEGLKVPKGCRPGLVWSHVSGRIEGGYSRNVNLREVEAIRSHLKELLIDQGFDGSVGVITPFRNQVASLKRALFRELPVDIVKKCELQIATVDGFQGQERDLILFSPTMCETSPQSGIGFLQREWRRINVAISRARGVAQIFGDLDYARGCNIAVLRRLAARATEPPVRSGEGDFDSEWERIVYSELRCRGLDPKPQFEIAGRRLDFALFGEGDIKLDLEVDGRMFHQDTDGNRKLDDHWRDHQMRSLGWRVRRFWVDELKQDLEGCINVVERDLKK